jgi:hypothetical protein|mmetsp:Transcript_74070/g.217013  ORF Transcript_74070/g.217013 Transcript_74070/m.217013 type:complete len:282 (+) Transcript_74070:96-941(+)
MVFLDETRSFWPLPLRRSFSGEKRGLSRSSSSSEADSDPDRCWDIADSVERGLARELTADFVQPLARTNGFHRFRVLRSADRQQYRVFREGGEFLMFASVAKDSKRIDIFTYDPQQSDSLLYDPERPAFAMSLSGQRSEWQLTQERCDRCRHTQAKSCNCQGRQDLLRLRMSKQEVGDGTNYRMTAFAPPGPQGGCGDGNACTLVTKSPRWDRKIQCMVLSFKGRKIVASAKNFQLTAEGSPDHVVCQYGKIEKDTFALDVRHPMTIVQAFATSLSTVDWL